MEWHLKTAEKELINAFSSFLSKNHNLFEHRKLYIWGASVRGTLLGMLLEDNHWQNFLYLDNDSRKWGKQIHGHMILPPEQMAGKANAYVLVPIEYGESLRLQLEGMGLEEGHSFSIMQSGINEGFAEEFYRNYENKRLVFGETFLNEIVIGEPNAKSMKEILWRSFGKLQTKILSMNCMGMESFYHILKLQKELFGTPEELWIFLNYETLTAHHHLLSRTQHADAWKMIWQRERIQSDEVARYIQKTETRALNFQIELKYSPPRVSVDSEEARARSQKEYLRQNMMYRLDLCSEEGQFLKKILEFAQESKISVTGISVPVNISLATRYQGIAFMDAFTENNKTLQELFLGHNADFINLGNFLSAQYFCAEVTVNDAIYTQGLELIAAELKEQIKERKGRNGICADKQS